MPAYTGYKINRKGDNVRDLLDKIDELEEVTPFKAGTMSTSDKRKLDNIESMSLEDIDMICV